MHILLSLYRLSRLACVVVAYDCRFLFALNWKREKTHYCDGSSFAGDGEDKVDLILGVLEMIFNFVVADNKVKQLKDKFFSF